MASSAPDLELVIGVVALAMGVITLIDLATDASSSVWRWATAGIWFVIGTGWIVQWRRAVKQYDATSAEQ